MNSVSDHAVAGLPSDFFIEIVTDAFAGKTQIARHRAINSLLSEGEFIWSNL